MSEKSLVDQIRHYQKDIERCPENAERMLRCIKRLYLMPIKVEHLSETGVGRSVNGLRKIDGPVADAATALVAKWKAMVAAEDSECEGDAAEEHPPEEIAENDVSSKLCNGSESPEQFSHSQKSKDKENLRNNHSVKTKGNSKYKESKETPKPDREKKKENPHKEHSSSKSSSKDKSISSSSGKSKEKIVEKVKTESKSHQEKRSSSSSQREEATSKEKKKDKHSSKEKKVEKHSNSESKHSSKHKSKEHSKSHYSHHSDSESEVERKKPCKRKHSSQHFESSHKKIKIKQEPKSESEPESELENTSHHSAESSAEEDYGSDAHGSDRSRESSPEPRIKPELDSDLDSDSDHSSHKKHSKSKLKSSSSHSKSKHSNKHSSHKKRHSEDSEFTNQELEELIKQNEKMIKKEKIEVAKEKISSKNEMKKPKVKIEANQDGSIDSGSGASFADALLGLDSVPKKKKKEESKKKKSSVVSSPSKASSVTSSTRSSPAPSVTSSVGSSPAKPYKSPISNLMKEPELLTKRIKLESPMDLDISSTLPEISTNYRPLPQIPQKVTRGASIDENAMFAIMTTKNQRTKVFSGSSKKGYLQQVPSLYSFCIQVLYDNIDGLEYTGGVPYEILKPLLDKLSADQLLGLEHFNPYLVEDTDVLWEFHAKKDFRTKQREEDETWREFYLRCTDEREFKLKRLTSNIIESMAKSTPVRQAKLAYVDTVAKPPRNIARKQAKYGTGSSGSGESAKIAAAAQNAQKKKEIVSKAVVGAYTPSTPATDVVPASPAAASPAQFNNPQTAAKLLKKKKAPLMAKALQLIKSNSRYKR